MSLTLKCQIIAFVLIFLIFVIYAIYKQKLRLKYALLWLFSGFIMLVATIVPNLVETISKCLGFEIASNMVFLIGFIMLLLVAFTLTCVISGQSKKIKLLIQEVSILKRGG